MLQLQNQAIATVTGIAPQEQTGIVAGKVMAVEGQQVTVRVKPKGDRVYPFHVQLTNPNADLKPKPGWRSRFEVVWQDGELVIMGCRGLKSKPHSTAAAGR